MVIRTHKQRITQFTSSEILTLLKSTRVVLKKHGLLILKAPAPQGAGRLLFQISKKAGSAPERNKLRRRLKEIFKKYQLAENNTALVIRASSQGIQLSFQELKEMCAAVCARLQINEIEKLPHQASE